VVTIIDERVSIADATTRVSAIQAQITALTTAFTPQTATPPATSSGKTTFASQLAAAQATAGGAMTASSPIAAAGDVTGLGSTALGAGAAALGPGGAALPAGATAQLTSAQQQFAARLAADTGLNTGVVSAWLLAEESGGAAQSRQAANNNDWLNIGYTDSGTYGSSDAVWSNPLTAADATAGWLKGQTTIPGYGTASAGIQAILATAGQDPSAQISALQNSGWASSGYPSLPSLYQQILA
jgi:hypothetical protein